MTMEFKVTGFAELRQSLEQLNSVTRSENALKRAMLNAIEPTADLTRALVPVRSGNLKRSIIVSDKLKGRAKEADVVSVFLGTSYRKGARGRHGHLVEFGTVRARPHPFLRPAWDQDGRALLSRLSSEIRIQIERAVKRKV
jgi:HK97 gp10 family phage protein